MSITLSLDTINSLLYTANYIFAEEVHTDYIDLQYNSNTDFSAEDNSKSSRLYHLITSLQYRADNDLIDDTTLALYLDLEREIGLGSTTIVTDPFYLPPIDSSIPALNNLFIYNQNSLAQSANFWISGTGKISTTPVSPIDILRLTDLTGYATQAYVQSQLSTNSIYFEAGSLLGNGTDVDGERFQPNATNGLTVSNGSGIQLGGSLLQNTIITTTGYSLSFTTDNGILYSADYSSDFVDRSLIDKGYADATYATISGSATGTNGLSGSGTILLGGSLTGYTTIDVNTNTLEISGTDGTNSLLTTFAPNDYRISVSNNTGVNTTFEMSPAFFQFGTQSTSGPGFNTYINIGAITSTGVNIVDHISSIGLRYASDYSANGVSIAGSRWIPDLGYITDHFGTGSGTVTAVSVAAANGFTGTSSGGATPALTLTLQNATTSQSGQLTSTDWNIFNNKLSTSTASSTYQTLANLQTTLSSSTTQYPSGSAVTTAISSKITLTSLSATSPIFYDNTTGIISSQVATSSQNGYLSSSDWSTFNGKISTINGIAAGGDLTGTYPNPTIKASVVLTGIPSTPALNITGTAGAGYINFVKQSAGPSFPSGTTTNLYIDPSGFLTLRGGGAGWGYSFSDASLTGFHTYILPNANGTIALTATTLAGYGITDAYPLSGNPSSFLTSITSSQVTTALGYTPYNSTNPSGYISANQTITLTGDITGSGTTAITTTLKNTGTSGTFGQVSTDAQGRVTSGSTLNPYANGGTNAATSWMQGSIIFAGATAFAQDNTNFFWDGTNHFLGLGTAVPTNTLTYSSTSTGWKHFNTTDQVTNTQFASGTFSGTGTSAIYTIQTGNTGTGSIATFNITGQGTININGGSNILAIGGTTSTTAGFFNMTRSSGGNVPILSLTGTSTAASGQVNGFVINRTYNQTSTAASTDFLLNRIETAVGSGAQLLMDLQVGSSSRFNIANTGAITITSIATNQLTIVNGSGTVPFAISTSGNLTVTPTGGQSTFSGILSTSQLTVASSNNTIYLPTVTGITHHTLSQFSFGGASSVGSLRAGFYGNTSTTLTVNDNYGGYIFGNAAVTLSSGTSNLSNVVIKSVTITSVGSATVPISANLWIDGLPTGATNNYGIYLYGGSNIAQTGSSSGVIAFNTQAAAGTYNFNWPTTAGTTGYLLTSGGGGNTAQTWTSNGGLLVWTEVVVATQTISTRQAYIATSTGGSQLVFTLPTTAAVGDIFSIVGNGGGGWKIAQNASQLIKMSGTTSTAGVTGSVTSGTRYDSVEVICIVTNTTFAVRNSQGTLTLV